jgi:glycosyltransferase involved in cell wall biosynthesis
MKVLFVSPYPPAKDGIGMYTQAFVTQLRSRGDEAGIVLPRMQISLSEDVVGNLGPRQAELAALCKSVVSWGPDIIHVQFAIPAFGTRTLALFKFLRAIRTECGAPIVVTAHEVTRETAMLGWLGRLIHRQLAARCDRLIVHTRAACAELAGPVGVSKAKISVIPHPEATPPRIVATAEDVRARFDLGDAELLVAFGFIHVDKGLDDLVQAIRIVNRSEAVLLDNWRLVIAGAVRPRQGPFRLFEFRDRLHLRRVLRMAARAKLRDSVVLTGYVPDADVGAWFQAAAAVVLPYRRTEQSGVAALANAFRVPVLASTAGGLGEQYEGSDWIFPPRCPKDLANVLAKFIHASPGERVATFGTRPAAGLSSVVGATRDLYNAVAWSMAN